MPLHNQSKMIQPHKQTAQLHLQVDKPHVQITQPLLQMEEPHKQIAQPWLQMREPQLQSTQPLALIISPHEQKTNSHLQMTETLKRFHAVCGYVLFASQQICHSELVPVSASLKYQTI